MPRLPSPSASNGFSRRAFLALLGLSGAVGLTGRAAAKEDPAAASPAEVLRQTDGQGSCGPCAIGNALLHGDAAGRRAFHQLPGGTSGQRLDAFIARYGAKPSETYGSRRARFVAGAGITNDDMAFMANDCFRDTGLPVTGAHWLDQGPGEEGTAHARRVHGLFKASLARGLPPVVEIRSFSADAGTHGASWTNLSAHWMALVGVEPGELGPETLGFTCRFADSASGRVIPAFAYAEIFRPYRATRGFKLRADGSKDWLWVEGRPYLLLNVPDLPMYANTRLSNERTLIALTYALQRGKDEG